MRSTECKAFLAAVEVWKEKCLIRGSSLLGAETLWTLELFQELHRCYVLKPLADSRTFIEKLKIQLAPASPEAKRLWSEMEWLYYLIVNHVRPETKLDKIKTPWEWSGASFPDDSPLLGDVLAKGTVNGGLRFNTNKWLEMRYIVECMVAWYELSGETKRSLISDPWKFTDWLDKQPNSKSCVFRHAILFYLFPDSFEDILSHKHKRRITERFNVELGIQQNTTQLSLRELDQQLLRVRTRLNEQNPDIEVSFYDLPFKEVWDPSDEPVDEDSESPSDWFEERFGQVSVWLLSPGEGARLWSDFLDSGIAAIGWDDLGDLNELNSREELEVKLSDFSYGRGSARMIWSFYHEMNVGDIVVAKKGRSSIVGYGQIEGVYTYEDERTEYCNTRRTAWHISPKPIELQQKLAMKTLTRIGDDTDWLRGIIEFIDGNGDGGFSTDEEDESKQYDIALALNDVFLDETELRRILDAIALRKNLVLQGPPGVGKTYISRRIAWLLMGEMDASRVVMVQFHQSYSYEDFVQGWRPTPSGGFTLKNGVFYEFCRRASEFPDLPFIFIVDEINRGNLSRIFGELLMLIESDKRGSDHAIKLTYSDTGETFYVPENVHLLGLMNTADRSLAIVDYALRRRFAFETLDPAFGKPRFREYLIEIGVDRELVNQIESRLGMVNDRIRSDPDLGAGFEIGHSYFVPDGEPDERWYRVVVETQIEPLLREYWFDHPELVEEIKRDLLS